MLSHINVKKCSFFVIAHICSIILVCLWELISALVCVCDNLPQPLCVHVCMCVCQNFQYLKFTSELIEWTENWRESKCAFEKPLNCAIDTYDRGVEMTGPVQLPQSVLVQVACSSEEVWVCRALLPLSLTHVGLIINLHYICCRTELTLTNHSTSTQFSLCALCLCDLWYEINI